MVGASALLLVLLVRGIALLGRQPASAARPQENR
jgi:hypothetical protein